MTDKTVYVAVTPAMRRVLAAMAENIVEMLDQIDGDENLEEPGDLEPSLGWPMGHGLSQLDKTMRHDDEREADFCDDEDNGDTEPNGDERDCDLAGATTDLEYDYGFYDGPLRIEGGQGL